VLADTRVVPQALEATRDHLEPFFADVRGRIAAGVAPKDEHAGGLGAEPSLLGEPPSSAAGLGAEPSLLGEPPSIGGCKT